MDVLRELYTTLPLGPSNQFFLVGTHSTAVENPSSAQKAFSPLIILIKETPVKLLTVPPATIKVGLLFLF